MGAASNSKYARGKMAKIKFIDWIDKKNNIFT